MSEWWTYTLSDIAMFSRQTYYRLFELHNAAVWPAHIAALAGGVLCWRLTRRAELSRGRVVAGILAALWIWVAVAFHFTRYATIHSAGVHFAALFGLQAALLLWTALRGRFAFESRASTAARVGSGICLFAVLAQPFVGLLSGRGWRQLELFGVAPDPTAVATLGVVLLAAGRFRWELAALPLLWCVISAATLVAIEAPEGWLMAIVAALVVSAAIGRSRARRRRSSERPESERLRDVRT